MAMANLRAFRTRHAAALNERITVELELPRWLLQVLDYRVEEANRDAEAAEQVDRNDVIEWHLVAPITLSELPVIEGTLPGTTAAIAEWLNSAVYDPDGL
jgi:hypothetical protein